MSVPHCCVCLNDWVCGADCSPDGTPMVCGAHNLSAGPRCWHCGSGPGECWCGSETVKLSTEDAPAILALRQIELWRILLRDRRKPEWARLLGMKQTAASGGLYQ